MITDPITGETISFIPLVLTEGEESEVITLEITPEAATALIDATSDLNAAIFARIAPAAFQDISITPLDISAYFGASVEVDFKVVASDPLPGLTRILRTASIKINNAAGWLN